MNRDADFLAGVILTTMLWALVIFAVCTYQGCRPRSSFEREAVLVGAATYQLNTNTWDREFIWLTNKVNVQVIK